MKNYSNKNDVKHYNMLKFRQYEKATKFEKISHLFWQKHLFLLSSVKTSGRFFRIFVAFSEKVDFKNLWYHEIVVFAFKKACIVHEIIGSQNLEFGFV